MFLCLPIAVPARVSSTYHVLQIYLVNLPKSKFERTNQKLIICRSLRTHFNPLDLRDGGENKTCRINFAEILKMHESLINFH